MFVACIHSKPVGEKGETVEPRPVIEFDNPIAIFRCVIFLVDINCCLVSHTHHLITRALLSKRDTEHVRTHRYQTEVRPGIVKYHTHWVVRASWHFAYVNSARYCCWLAQRSVTIVDAEVINGQFFPRQRFYRIMCVSLLGYHVVAFRGDVANR